MRTVYVYDFFFRYAQYAHAYFFWFLGVEWISKSINILLLIRCCFDGVERDFVFVNLILWNLNKQMFRRNCYVQLNLINRHFYTHYPHTKNWVILIANLLIFYCSFVKQKLNFLIIINREKMAWYFFCHIRF